MPPSALNTQIYDKVLHTDDIVRYAKHILLNGAINIMLRVANKPWLNIM